MTTQSMRGSGSASASAGTQAAREVTEALTGFVTDFKGFQDQITTRMQQQEERIAMLSTKTMTHRRPALEGAQATDAPHQKALDAYLRCGDDEGLRNLTLEGKAMNTAVAMSIL